MGGSGALRTVVVTGGAGFVGSALCRRLSAAGAERVVVIDDFSRGDARNLGVVEGSIELVQVDVRDSGSLQRALERVCPDLVIHLAAIHFIPECEADPRRCFDVNVGGTTSVLSVCAELAAKPAVVVASSGAVYGATTAKHPEDEPCAPTDIYGLSKLWAEHLCALYHQRSQLRVGVVRLFNVIGPGETNPHLIPELAGQALRGNDIVAGNLSSQRDYVYVEDAARAIQALGSAVTTTHDWLICNVGGGRAVRGDEVVAVLGELLGRTLTVHTDPARLRRSDNPVLLSDNSRALAELGWRPEATLRDALSAALERPLAYAPKFGFADSAVAAAGS